MERRGGHMEKFLALWRCTVFVGRSPQNRASQVNPLHWFHVNIERSEPLHNDQILQAKAGADQPLYNRKNVVSTALTDDGITTVEYKLSKVTNNDMKYVNHLLSDKLSDESSDEEKLQVLIGLCSIKKIHLLVQVICCKPYVQDVFSHHQDQLTQHLCSTLLLPQCKRISSRDVTDVAMVLDVLYETVCLKVKGNKQLLLTIIWVLQKTHLNDLLFFWAIDRYDLPAISTKTARQVHTVERFLLYCVETREGSHSCMYKNVSNNISFHLLETCAVNSLTKLNLEITVTNHNTDGLVQISCNTFSKKADCEVEWDPIVLQNIRHLVHWVTADLLPLKIDDVEWQLAKAGYNIPLKNIVHDHQSHLRVCQSTSKEAFRVSGDRANLVFVLLAVIIKALLSTCLPISSTRNDLLMTASNCLRFTTSQKNRLSMIILQNGGKPHKYGYIYPTKRHMFTGKPATTLDNDIQKELLLYHAELFQMRKDILLACSRTCNDTYKHVDEERQTQPSSLYFLCQETLKGTLNVPYTTAIDHLPLPIGLKKNLTFKSYQKLYKECECEGTDVYSFTEKYLSTL